MSVRDEYESGAFQNTSSSGFAGQKSTSIRDSYRFDQRLVDERLKQEQEDERKKREEEAKRKIESSRPGGLLGVLGDFTAAVNEKVLGGAVRTAVKTANMLTTGFNADEAEKRTNEFLKTTGQAGNQSEAALASGSGINRESEAFQTGQASGDTIKTLVGVDAPAQIYKSAKNLVDQARISGEMDFGTTDLDQPSADKLKKFVDEDEKAGLLSKEQADEKRNKIQSVVDKTNQAIKRGEEKTGTKYDRDSGVVSLLETSANAAGLTGALKSVFENAVAAASKRLGRNLTDDEVKRLAEQTKKTVPTETKADEVLPDATPDAQPVPAPVQQTIAPQATSIEDTVVNAAKMKAEERLGRELAPEEIDNLRQSAGRVLSNESSTPEIKPTVQLSEVQPKIPEAKPPQGDTVSGNALRIEQVALEKKLTEKMGDLPQYKSINMKEQAKEAVDLIRTNKQQAIDIIEGKSNPPGNLRAQSVHQALEDIAVREGDGELLTKLAKSNVNTELSESAQNLRISAERDPHSAVEQIRQIRDARVKAAERRGKTTVSKATAEARRQVAAATPRATKQDWNSFVKELTC